MERTIRCEGTIYDECDCTHEAIASATTETWSFARTACAQHLAPVLNGSCGQAAIEYFNDRYTQIFVEYVDDRRSVTVKITDPALISAFI